MGGILFAACTFGVLVAILWSAKAKTTPLAPGTALLNIIVAPSQTLPAPQVTLTPTLEPHSTQEAPQASGEIAIGDYVQVIGTGGDGLRLHATAGVSGEVRYVAIESEVFQVKDGPVDADGYTWWLLEDPYTENAVGWGVSNYLGGVQTP
ncbi:MAG: hypothetical protein A2136_05390 [Chloroflexi bacterium RBG_16_54_11]|nr:MAG: hypothetical protein A2136_05390 [Chloroflexi bacterium RBG_16_54_11]